MQKYSSTSTEYFEKYSSTFRVLFEYFGMHTYRWRCSLRVIVCIYSCSMGKPTHPYSSTIRLFWVENASFWGHIRHTVALCGKIMIIYFQYASICVFLRNFEDWKIGFLRNLRHLRKKYSSTSTEYFKKYSWVRVLRVWNETLWEYQYTKCCDELLSICKTSSR